MTDFQPISSLKTIKIISFFMVLICVFSAPDTQAKALDMYGIGIMTMNTEADIEFFENPQDEQPVATLKFKPRDDGSIAFDCPVDLDPYIQYEGDTHEEAQEAENLGLVKTDSVLKFVVIRKTQDYYAVLVNTTDALLYYIKKDKAAVYYDSLIDFEAGLHAQPFNPNWYFFETWERYLKRVEFVELDELEIFDAPNGTILYQSSSYKFLPFKVEHVEGEWMKLTIDALRDFRYEDGVDYFGWYQWKRGNALRIDITEFTIE